MNWIRYWWRRYCHWVDSNGLNGNHCSRCIPLDERAQQALKEQSSDR